jgi:hypothetical protein
VVVVATEEQPGDSSAGVILEDFVRHLSLSAALQQEIGPDAYLIP